jgi:hypothetical protein
MAMNMVKARGQLCQAGATKAAPGELKAEGPEPRRKVQPQFWQASPHWPGIPAMWPQTGTKPEPRPR